LTTLPSASDIPEAPRISEELQSFVWQAQFLGLAGDAGG